MPQASTSIQLPHKWYAIAVTDPNIAAWYAQLRGDHPDEPESVIDHMMRSINDYGDGSGPGYDYRTAIEKGLRPSVQPDGKYHWGGDVQASTRVQQIKDEDVGRVKKIQQQAQEQQEVADNYRDLMRMYPESWSTVKSMMKEGVFDIATLSRAARLEAEKKSGTSKKRTTWEKTSAEYSRGRENIINDILWFEYITGMGNLSLEELTNLTKEAEERMAADPIDAEGWFEEIMLPFSSILYGMGKSVEYGARGALAAMTPVAIAGQLIPGLVAVPEELITLPVAGALGAKAGVASFWYMQGTGSIYKALHQAGVDPTIAVAVSSFGGVPYALLEQAQMKGLVPKSFTKEFADLLTKSVGQTLLKIGKETGKTYTLENIQELGQESVLIASEEIGAWLENKINEGEIDQATADQILERMLATAEQSMKAFIIPVGVGGAVSAGTGVSKVRKEQRAEAASIEAIAVSRLSPEGVAGVDEKGRKVTLGRPAQLRIEEEEPVEKRKTETDALSEVDAALDAGDTTPGVAALAKHLIGQDPDFDVRSSLEISDHVLKITDDYIRNVLGKEPEQFFKEEGITREEAEEYFATGSTQVDIQKGVAKTAIKLYQGHDADTLVEEWYHDFFEHMDAKDRKVFDAYHKKSKDTRSVEEHFGQEGRDFFFSEKMHEKAGPIRAIFDKARQSLKDLIARIRTIRGAKIPKKIQSMYTAAAKRQLKPLNKKQKTDLKKRKLLFQLRSKPKSKEFKSWFGDSKVVDEKGQPMVVYHGTAKDFDEFRVPKVPSPTIYFSNDPDVANNYSIPLGDSPEDQPNVMPVYLKIENPFNYTLDLNKKEDREVATDLDKKIYNEGFSTEVVDQLKKEGYDGIVDEQHNIYQVFEPNQVKGQFNVKPTKGPKIMHQVKKVPTAEEGVPILPTGPIETSLAKSFARKENPSAYMLKQIQGAPSKRKKHVRTLDKGVKTENFDVYVDRVEKELKRSPEQAFWYYEYGEGGQNIVGEENMREFSVLFGITSAQTNTADNLENTMWIMTLARKINPRTQEQQFKDALREPKPNGNKMLIQGDQINSVVEMYKTGTYQGGLKVSNYMQTVEAAAANKFMPFTVNDIHMQRFFGFNRKDKDGKTLPIQESNHRYIQFLVHKIADKLGISPSMAQAIAWKWARENLSTYKKLGTWDEAVKHSAEIIKGYEKVKSPSTDINKKFGTSKRPSYLGKQKAGPYSNVLYTDAVLLETLRKSPRILASFVPGRARGFLTGELDLKKARAYDDAVFKAITDETGQIKFLKALHIPHHIVKTIGSYGHLETSYQIILPGASLEQAKLIALYMGDAGLQDSVIYYKNSYGKGDIGGLALMKKNNKAWTFKEIEAYHKRVNPNNEEDGVNFYQSADGKQLRILVFEGMEDMVSKQLEFYIKSNNFTIGDFDQTGDLIENESYNTEIKKVNSKLDIFRTRRSDIQRASRDTLYRPIQEVYKKHEKDFAPSKKIVFAVRHKRLIPKEKTPKQQALPGSEFDSLELDPETYFQWFQRGIQDKMNRLEHVMEKVSEKRDLSDEENVYMAQDLYIGKAKQILDKFQESVADLLDRIIDAGYTIDDFGEYLHARHAEERNKHVAKINDKLPDGGSGMFTKDANAILEKYKGDKKIEALANEFYRKVTKRGLRMRLDSGLIDRATFDKLTKYYENYVPLFIVKEVENPSAPSGKGLSIPQGAELKRVKGSLETRGNPVWSATDDMSNLIRRAEKNKVGLKFLDIAEEFPSKAWTVSKQRYRPVYNQNGELEFMDPQFDLADNTYAVRREGKLFLINIEDQALADGMKNLGIKDGYKTLNTIGAFIRSVVTTFSPPFVIMNFTRDIQTALVHISGEYKGLTSTVAKNVLPAMRGVWKNIRDKKSNYWSERYDEMKKAGGKIGWFDYDDLSAHQAKIEKMLRNVEKGKGGWGAVLKAGRGLGELVEHANEAVESAVRLAVFDALVKDGKSETKAASVAKGITVNFNKKGRWGTWANSLYLFFNATVQGTWRMSWSIAKHRKTRMIVAGIVANSMLISLKNWYVDPDEWEEKPDWEKDNYMYLWHLDDGSFIRVRVPYGLNIFHVMGTVLGDAVHEANKNGVENVDVFNHVGRVFGAISDAVNPLGTGSWGQALTPTAFDWIVQLSENKNFMGTPIIPEKSPYGPETADYTNYYEKHPPTWIARWVTRSLSLMFGGEETKKFKQKKDETWEDRIIPGKVDISPDTIDHILEFFTGGLGKFISRTINTGIDFAVGKETNWRQVPFVRQWYHPPDKSGQVQKRLIYSMIKKSKIKKYNHIEVSRFKKYVYKAMQLQALKEDQIKLVKDVDGNEVPKIIRDFMKNQRWAWGIPEPVKKKGRSRTRSTRRKKKK